MHHGGNSKKKWGKIAINGGLHLNLSLCCGIHAHLNNSVINWITFFVCNYVGATL
jgi:hypothetical protein